MSTGTNTGIKLGRAVLLAMRLVIAGLFIWSASVKLGLFGSESADAVRDFRQSIKGFYILPEHITDPLAFIIPWTELLCAAALILGFWGRAAALVLAGLLLTFIGAIVSVIYRPEIHTSCGCFGKFTLMCPPGEVGWCNVQQNLILLAIALPVIIWGPGALSLDARAACRRRGAAPAVDSDPAAS